jgi:tRNA pseudouridine38-40 synthase
VPTYRLDLAYDGSGFRGFARQPDQRTVQGEVEAVLERVFGHPVLTVGAGRTDTGVHARNQVVSFVEESDLEPATIKRAVTGLLSPGIVATACTLVDEAFDARFSARWRSYRYRVLNTPDLDPLLHASTWHVSDPLDLGAMNRAAAALVGEHDFASFCRKAEGRTTERTVLEAVWEPIDGLVVLRIRATAFCHQMVRSIAGFCVDVGRGRATAESVASVLAAKDRAAARPIAPPQGLVLWEVGYEKPATGCR